MLVSQSEKRAVWMTDPIDLIVAGSALTFKPFAHGGGKLLPVPQGHAFAGRLQGSGIRAQVYGTRAYGSGYPLGQGRGVNGRWFPFYFWPVVWLGNSMNPNNTYLYSTEYGLPNNETRPGGVLTTLTYVSNAASSTTFRILTDDVTALYLRTNLAFCNSFLNVSSVNPEPYPTPTGASVPLPVQAVQYYRASSVVLTLDGYNNTAALFPAGSQPNTFLPGGTDTKLLECLNHTIGSSVILFHDDTRSLSAAAVIGIVVASVGAALLLCLSCSLFEERRRRRRRLTKRVSGPTTSGPADRNAAAAADMVTPPPPAAAPPIPSGAPPQYKAKTASTEEWADVGLAYAYDDEASLIRNAGAIDGAANGGEQWQEPPRPGKRASGSDAPWKMKWGRGGARRDDHIELKTAANRKS